MGKRAGVVLTKTVVEAAKPTGKRFHVWDSDLVGFGLRVEKTGIKSFIAKYRSHGGGRNAPQRLVIIGRFGAMTAEQARKKAKTVLGSVAAGADPAGDIRAKRSEMTMLALLDFYETHGCVVQRGKRIGEAMKPLTKQYTMARLRHHVVPLLGHRRATEITPGDIERFSAEVSAGKTAKDEKVGPRKRIIVKGGPGASRKVVRDLSAVFSFARRSEIVDRNPCDTAAVRKTDDQKTRLLTLEEVSRLGKAFDDLEAEGANAKAVNIARLWALTGCRRNEIAGLKWSEVDFENGMLKFEASKTGRSMRPLGTAALTLLKQIEPKDDCEYVFPASSGEGYFQGAKTPWARAIEKADLPGVSPHTLRHTIGSTAISSGEAMALTGAILGHSNPRSTAIYAHIQHVPSRKAAIRVSDTIALALSNTAPADPASQQAEADLELLNLLGERLAKEGPAAVNLRVALRMLMGVDGITVAA